jgi:hypothetical protein
LDNSYPKISLPQFYNTVKSKHSQSNHRPFHGHNCNFLIQIGHQKWICFTSQSWVHQSYSCKCTNLVLGRNIHFAKPAYRFIKKRLVFCEKNAIPAFSSIIIYWLTCFLHLIYHFRIQVLHYEIWFWSSQSLKNSYQIMQYPHKCLWNKDWF